MKKIRLSVPLLLSVGRYGMWEYHIKGAILNHDEDLEQQRKTTRSMAKPGK